jgi:RNA polymerase sigma-70 factor (family 1)
MDEEYFKSVYKKYFQPLYFFAVRLVGNPQTAEDIVQEVFMKCWIKRDAIDVSLPLKSYFYRLTYRGCLDFLKNKKEHVILCCDMMLLENTFYLSYVPEPDTLLSLKEISREITKAVCSLPPRCRQVFILSRYFNLKNNEIAEKLNISVNNVEKHITKAIKKIHADLTVKGL